MKNQPMNPMKTQAMIRRNYHLLLTAIADENVPLDMEYELNLKRLRSPEGSPEFKDGLRGLKAAALEGHAPSAAAMADFLLRHPQYSLNGYERQVFAWIAEMGDLPQPHHLADLKESEWIQLQKTMIHMEITPGLLIDPLVNECPPLQDFDFMPDRCA